MLLCYLIKLFYAIRPNSFLMLYLNSIYSVLLILSYLFCFTYSVLLILFYLFCFTYSVLLIYHILHFLMLFFSHYFFGFLSSYLTISTANSLIRNVSILPRCFYQLLFYFHDSLFIYFFIFLLLFFSFYFIFI